MKNNTYYWNSESWGNGVPPVNADEIICMANDMIDQYIAGHPDYDSPEINAYAERLWEDFCRTGEINGIIAAYED